MNRLQYVLAVCILIIAAIPGTAQNAPIRLPADPATPVITFDRRGGLTAPRIKSTPVLTIRANGEVTVVDPFRNGGEISGALTTKELQDLLNFIVTERDFFAIDRGNIDATIQQEMRRSGIGFGVDDASDTVIKIRIADQEHETSFNAVSFFASRYPNIAALGNLAAIDSRLGTLVQNFRSGGSDKIAEALAQANASLKRDYPNLAPLTEKNYLRTLESDNGRKLMQFLRDQGDNTNLSVTVQFESNRDTEVRIMIQRKPPF
jgi:hypothetical protein